MNDISFEPWPKMDRLSKMGVVITEKIDGTNAQVIITDDGRIGAASRTRLITPDYDNFGFAAWVQANKEELLKLGPGRHFGEWWGRGIQRGYGLKEKRFSLFNANRWYEAYQMMVSGYANDFPKCCHVVPILSRVSLANLAAGINEALKTLTNLGSLAAPFTNPEGIVAYFGGQNFKYTFEDKHKWETGNAIVDVANSSVHVDSGGG